MFTRDAQYAQEGLDPSDIQGWAQQELELAFGGYGPWKLEGSASAMNMDPGANAKMTSDAILCEVPYC